MPWCTDNEGDVSAHLRPAVVHVMGTIRVGGAETSLLRLIGELRRFGTRSFVFCVDGDAGEMRPEFEEQGAEIEVVNIKRRPLSSSWRFARVLMETKPRAVVGHIGLPTAYFLLLAQLLGISRRVAVMHSVSSLKTASRIRTTREKALRHLLRHTSTSIIGVSEAALRYGTGTREVRRTDRVIANGIDLDSLTPPKATPISESVRVLYIGRNERVKNRGRLVGISRELMTYGHPPITVVGEVGEDVRAHERELVLLGARNDINLLMESADVLVLVSEEEGQGVVILEALAKGLPVVTSITGGSIELARRLKGVELLSLEAPDQQWASALVESARRYSVEERLEFREQLLTRGYDIRDIAAAWSRVLGLGQWR